MRAKSWHKTIVVDRFLPGMLECVTQIFPQYLQIFSKESHMITQEKALEILDSYINA